MLLPKLIYFIFYLMPSCFLDNDCSYFHHCKQLKCIHDQIFPLSPSTIVIYLVIGLLAAICNISGHSMGIFKVLVLIVMLNYNIDQSTGLAQALVVGTSIPNFITVITQKHPRLNTSLVNFHVLELIIPCSLLGSTVGALGQAFLPKLVQIIFLILIFSFFTFNFLVKLKNLKPKNEQLQIEQLVNIKQQYQIQVHQKSEQKIKILKYEESYHLIDIVRTILIFCIFQFLAFLVQGKLWFYEIEKCDLSYPLGILLLFFVTLVYINYVRIRLKRISLKYKQHLIKQEIQFHNTSNILVIIFGGFMAGIIQGIIGLGSGTCIMLLLLSFRVNPRVATATTGYQILFTGSASLSEYYIKGQIQPVQIFWFGGICLIIGGAMTILLYKIMKKINQYKITKFILILILTLCLMSIVLTIPILLKILDEGGWQSLIQINFIC